MTVGELKRQLAHLDDKMEIAVYHEPSSGDSTLHDVIDAVSRRGTPLRLPATNKPAFVFDGTGPATWLFLLVKEAE
jgi:hypothetical protein